MGEHHTKMNPITQSGCGGGLSASGSRLVSGFCEHGNELNSFVILYYDQQMHNYFTNYYTATCFDTIVSSSRSL